MARNAENTDAYTMSFGDHLEELRKRLLLALVVPLPVAVGLFFVSKTLVLVLMRPLVQVLEGQNLPSQVQSLSPPEVILVQLKLSVILAIVLSAPWILWQLWLFIRPGLYKHERRFVYLLLPGSFVLSIVGLALMYFVMLPLMLLVLIKFGVALQQPADLIPYDASSVEVAEGAGTPAPTLQVLEEDPPSPAPGQIWLKMPEGDLKVAVLSGGAEEGQDQWLAILRWPMAPDGLVSQQYRIKDYVGFVLLLMAGIAIAFQMPLVILLLGWLGLASADWLRQRRRYALLVCGVVSALITPADVVSMLMMLLPLYGLYELGILLLLIAPASKVASGATFQWPRPRRGGREESDDRPGTGDET
ncbi:MAG: twin-arginine translocase subunit TatC [Phycisphaerales bacterium]|nr:MAG: twin-arginine translocase subunit TatC [Phycisphaerales bacterium]